jgi:arylsulfatase A-like enzyme
MITRPASTYSRKDFLVIAIWWGLVCGVGEGVRWSFKHSPVWHDQIRAALIINSLLFAGVALLTVALNRHMVVSRGLLLRTTLGFGCLAFYDWFDTLVPRYFYSLPLLSSLAAASIMAALFYRWSQPAMRFYARSLPLLAAIALWCVVVFPIQQRRSEAQQLRQLPPAAPGAPNILLIVVDTLRADHLSAYGYSRPTSPGLARIASQGLLFKNAVSASSWTLPSHASMLTGLYPHDHHADGGLDLGPGYRTLAEALQAHGYQTAAFSGNGPTFSRRNGFGRGFVHFEDDFQNLGSLSRETFYGYRVGTRLSRLHLLRNMPGRVSAEEINQHALQWIDSRSRPFFVVLNYLDAHDPYLPPDPYLHLYTKVRRPNKWYSEHWESFEHLTPEEKQAELDAYDGAINYIDAKIAYLLQKLSQRGLGKNTLVIITADHGEAFGEHGLMNHGNSLYRELIHVPLIFWEPGQIQAGKVVADPVSLTALPATVLDLIGDSGQQQFPGPSLTELWLDGHQPPIPAPPLSELAQFSWNVRYPNYYGPMRSVTTSEWHYITGGNSGEQLFRCCAEPETVNLASTSEGQKICQHFRQELQLGGRRDDERKQNLAADIINRTVRP